MRDLHDFNDPFHRIQSASAVFQRGIYHLFVHCRKADSDVYASVVRSYQTAYQLCLTILLLDFTHDLETKGKLGRLKAHATDSKAPTRAEIDPAGIVTNSVFEDYGKWPGPPPGSALREVGISALALIRRIVEARHNLIYRPFLLDRGGLYWDDCALLELLPGIPEPEEIRAIYEKFTNVVLLQRVAEVKSQAELHRLIAASSPGEARDHFKNSKQNWADYFLQLQFWPYMDEAGVRPTETILMTYGRMLNPGNELLLEELRAFRNELLRLTGMQPPLNLDPTWRLGEI